MHAGLQARDRARVQPAERPSGQRRARRRRRWRPRRPYREPAGQQRERAWRLHRAPRPAAMSSSSTRTSWAELGACSLGCGPVRCRTGGLAGPAWVTPSAASRHTAGSPRGGRGQPCPGGSRSRGRHGYRVLRRRCCRNGQAFFGVGGRVPALHGPLDGELVTDVRELFRRGGGEDEGTYPMAGRPRQHP